MNKQEWNTLRKDWSVQVAVLLFAVMVIWWVGLYAFETSYFTKMIWGASYQVVALWGAIWGIVISKKWGGTRSVMGRAILAFSTGLLLQNFGQTAFFAYNMFANVEIPYPSIADIGYFGSIPFYIYGTVLLARASGVSVSLKSFRNKLQAVAIPAIVLLLSYLFFLSHYEFDWSSPLRIFFDFGYPLGQAVYVSFALLTYLLTKKTLGGIMKHRILFILLALVVQYLADFNFLYQVSRETWVSMSYGDVIYLIAYLFMALGLIQLKTEFIKTRNHSES